MEEEEMYFIYFLICPIEKTIKYVGLAKDPYSRLVAHSGDYQHKNKGKWLKLLKKKKLKPELRIVDMVTEKDKFYWEKHYIKKLESMGVKLFNIQTYKDKEGYKKNVIVKTIKKTEKQLNQERVKKAKNYLKSIKK